MGVRCFKWLVIFVLWAVDVEVEEKEEEEVVEAVLRLTATLMKAYNLNMKLNQLVVAVLTVGLLC